MEGSPKDILFFGVKEGWYEVKMGERNAASQGSPGLYVRRKNYFWNNPIVAFLGAPFNLKRSKKVIEGRRIP